MNLPTPTEPCECGADTFRVSTGPSINLMALLAHSPVPPAIFYQVHTRLMEVYWTCVECKKDVIVHATAPEVEP
jgi:hypothetical protein